MRTLWKSVMVMAIAAMAAGPATAVEVTVKVNDSGGNPITGAAVKWNTGSWHNVGTTGVDGTLQFDVTEPYKTIVVTYHQTSDSMTMQDPRSTVVGTFSTPPES